MTNITPLDFDPDRRDRRLHFSDVDRDGPEDYFGIGADFAAARRRAGLDVSHVAATLRIRQEQLTAIEEGRFADLPAPAYAVGFVRSYAEFLGMDAGAAIQAFKQETENSVERVSLTFPTADAEDRVPRGWLLGMSAVLALVIFGAWFYSNNSGLIRPERVPLPPQSAAPAVAAGPEALALAQPAIAPLPVPAPAPADAADAGDDAPLAAIDVPAVEVVVPLGADAPPAAEIEAALVAPAPLAPDFNPAVGRVLGVIPVAPDAEGAVPAGDVQIGGALPVVQEPAAAAEAEAPVAAAETPTPIPLPAPAPVLPALVLIEEPIVAQLPVEPAVAQLPAEPAVAEALPGPVAAVLPGVPGRPVPDVEVAVLPAPPAAAPAPPVAEVDVAVLPPPPATAPAPRAPEVEVAVLPPPPVAPPAAAVPPPAPAEVAEIPGANPQVYGENQGARVVILARQDSWVQITGAAGELLLTRILRAGDRYLAPDREDLILMTGNAGALEITVDGVQIPLLGPVGTVRRNVSLAPDRLLAANR